MNSHATPLQKWIQDRIRTRVIAPAIFLSIFAGVFIGSIFLVLQIEHDRSLIGSIRSHASTLIETQDRPELLRLLHSVAESERVDIWTIQDGILLATSRDFQEMDRPYKSPRGLKLGATLITSLGIETEFEINRSGGPLVNAQLYLRRTFTRTLSPILLMTLGMLLFAVAMVLVVLIIVRQATIEALMPVSDLEAAIRSLKTFESPLLSSSSKISELETIRAAILESHKELKLARDHLAESRAKEMTTEAYRRTIHDLHTPVSALKRLIKLFAAESDEKIREEIATRIRRLAEQILNQVTAAKSHLALPAPVLVKNDVRETLREAIETARFASNRTDFRIQTDLPHNPTVLKYDSNLLGRAVMNLVGNAIDACRSEIVVRLRSSTDGRLVISVSDDGNGVSQEDVGLCLQGRGRSSKANRAGLGLSTANHIARTHGGRIVYQKSELGGACFEIRIENGS